MEREPEAAEAGHCTAGRAACTGPRRCTAEDTTAAVAAVAAWAFVVVLVFVVVGLVFVELESISKILVLSLVM